jgi:hypothetical protein
MMNEEDEEYDTYKSEIAEEDDRRSRGIAGLTSSRRK